MPRLSPPPISRFGLTGGQPLAPYADLSLRPPPAPPQALSQRAFAPFFEEGPGQGSADYPSVASAAPYNPYVQAAQWLKGQTDRGLVPDLLMGGISNLTNKQITGQPTKYLDYVGATLDLFPPGVDDLAELGVAGIGSLIGASAKNWNQDVADLVMKLKGAGKTDDEIWKKTGDYLRAENSPLAASLFEPKTGQVFTEYPDVDARFNPGGFAHGPNERLMEADDALVLKRLSNEMGNVQVNDMPVAEAVVDAFRQRYNREPSAGSWAASARASDELFDITLKEFNIPGPLSAKQGDVLDHPLMYEAYPEARDMPVNVVDSGPDILGGMVSGWGEPPRMTLSPATAFDTSLRQTGALSTMMHENTHGFPQGDTVGAATGASSGRGLSWRWIEDMAYRTGLAEDSPEQAQFLFEMWRRRGENPEKFDFQVYQRVVGEEQARAVEDRMLLPLEQLRKNPFHQSMDTPMAEQWVSRLSKGNAPQVGLPPPPKNLTPDEMRVWQGSPHKFDALDPSKIGTGEGAQAYGHGAYVAESRGVAQTYQPRDFDAEEIMMARYKEAESAGDYNRMEQWENAMMHDTPDDLRERSLDMDYDEDYRQAAAEVAEELADIPSASFLYEIDVPDEDIAKMLDWDAPLSEQPESVRKALENTPAAQRLNKMDADAREAFGDTYTDDWVTEASAGSLYREMAEELGAEGASKAMQDAGIPGIKYFDQGSRAAGDGTRNMVLFDELARRAKVLKRNSETMKKVN